MTPKEKLRFILVVIVVVAGAGLLIIQSSGASVYNGTSTMPYAVSNVTHNPQGVGSLYSYIIGNTSETDGFPAYEGPGSSQNQSMPQYIIIAIIPGNKHMHTFYLICHQKPNPLRSSLSRFISSASSII